MGKSGHWQKNVRLRFVSDLAKGDIDFTKATAWSTRNRHHIAFEKKHLCTQKSYWIASGPVHDKEGKAQLAFTISKDSTPRTVHGSTVVPSSANSDSTPLCSRTLTL